MYVVCQKRKAQKLSARMAKTYNTIDEETKYKAVLYFHLHAQTKSVDLKLDKFFIYNNYRINVYEYKPSWCIVTS